jgi:hypothetical protein
MVMSHATELQLYATEIPFIRDRSYRAFLPSQENGGEGIHIQDEWDVLALLIQRYDGTSDQRVVRYGCTDYVRVRVYEDYTRCNRPTATHLIPIPSFVVGQLLEMGYVVGTMRFGYVDQTELSITEQGVHALLGHTQVLSR